MHCSVIIKKILELTIFFSDLYFRYIKEEEELYLNSKEEEISFNLIANSGDGRSFAFSSLEHAKRGDFEQSDILMKKSDEAIATAHKSQTELLVATAKGESISLNVLLIHAQDHLMTSMLANELIKEIIYLYKK